MNLQAVIVANSFAVVLMVMLLVCAGKSLRRDLLSEKIFYGMIWATISLALTECLSFVLDGRTFPGARTICVICNELLFGINIIFCYLWILYVDYKLFEDMDRIRKRYGVLALPAAAVVIMLIINIFTPVLFSVSKENIYSRTPLTVICYVVSFFYLAYAEILIYTNRHNAKRYLFMPSVIFLFPILAGAIVQMLFYGISVTWATVSISMVSIYLNVQGEFSAVDSLSGVYTRQYLDSYFICIAGRRRQKKVLAGIMIDLDRFKSINDTYGHQAGDQAIRDIGKILRLSCSSEDVIARYGGDEFVIIGPPHKNMDMQRRIGIIEDNFAKYNNSGLMPYKLMFSYGCSYYYPDKDTIDDFLRRMDMSMYENKKEHSREMEDRRHSC